MTLNRRDVLALLGAGATAAQLDAFQHEHAKLAAAPQSYTLAFFSAEENRLIDELAEMIIPADQHSPGARAAKCSFYIDLVVANSASHVQQEWKRQLAAFQRGAGKPFLELVAADRAAYLDGLAASGEGDAARFFGKVKRLTVFGYYTSEIGVRQELGSRSPEAFAEFPGACRHAAGSHS